MYTILVVDDELPARKMFSLVLGQCTPGKYKIIGEAANGQIALQMAKEFSPDIIVTDIQMPVMDGITLIETCKLTKPEQLFIILSCHESFSYAQKAIRIGVTDYLIKDTLTPAMIESCLDNACKALKPRGTPEQKSPSEQGSFQYEQLKQLYPNHLASVESHLDKFCSSLSGQNYQESQVQLKRLYQTSFTGITQYNYLKHINDFVIGKIRSFCVKNKIDPAAVLVDDGSLDELLLSHPTPQSVCELLCEWISQLESLCSTGKNYSARIRSVITYINENYFQDISLQNIADLFSVHKVYLSRTFKEETGHTLNEYINMVRIEKAQFFLSVTNDKASDIASTVGFNNPQNFYAMFKKYAGCSPLEYREKIQR